MGDTRTGERPRNPKLEELERQLGATPEAGQMVPAAEPSPIAGTSRGWAPRRRRSGGGGLAGLLLGFILCAVGAYLIAQQVLVTSGYWWWLGPNTFGITLIPLVLGIAILFYDGRSVPGWLLAIGSTVVIFAGILVNLQVYFRPTTLFNTVLMLGLFAAGLGLTARGLLGGRND